MGIQLGSNFTLNTTLPLDDRYIFADTTARNGLASGRRYEGLTVYVVADGKNYQLIGGITDSDWVEFGGSGSGILTVADTAARDAIDSGDRYDGLIVYVIDIETNYQLRGGVTNSDWVDLDNAITAGDLTGTNITVTGGTGAVIGSGTSVSIPQSVATSATPTFAGMTVTGLSGPVKATAGVLSASTIVNADVSASAAIAVSKLAAVTASRALASDASGFITPATTTATELNYVSGVTSAIQTQINAKLTSPLTTDGDLLTISSGVPARFPVGSAGQVLTVGSGLPSWGTPLQILANIATPTSAYTVTTSNDIVECSGASFNLTLYTAVGNAGKFIRIVHKGTSLSQVYTFLTTGGQTVCGLSSGSYALYTAGEALTIYSNGTNWVRYAHDAETDWADFPSTAYGTLITATGSAASYGNSGSPVVNKAQWRRSGGDGFVIWDYRQTSAGIAGSGILLLNLIFSIDTARHAANTGTANTPASFDSRVGEFHINHAPNFGATGFVSPYSATQLKMYMVATNTSGGANCGFFGGSGYTDFSNNANLGATVRAQFKVSGWQP